MAQYACVNCLAALPIAGMLLPSFVPCISSSLCLRARFASALRMAAHAALELERQGEASWLTHAPTQP